MSAATSGSSRNTDNERDRTCRSVPLLSCQTEQAQIDITPSHELILVSTNSFLSGLAAQVRAGVCTINQKLTMYFAVGTLWSKIGPVKRGGDGVIRARRFAARVALSATVFAAGWVAGWLAGFGSLGIEITHAAPIEDSWAPRGAISVAADPEPVDAPKATATTSIANVKTEVSSAVPIVADVVTADPEPRTPIVGAAAAPVSGVATTDPDTPEPASLLPDVSAVVETPFARLSSSASARNTRAARVAVHV
jgi:hypothetical protein